MHDVALVVLAGAEQVVGVVEPIQDAENPVALVEPKQSYPLDGAQENIFLYNVQQRWIIGLKLARAKVRFPIVANLASARYLCWNYYLVFFKNLCSSS